MKHLTITLLTLLLVIGCSPPSEDAIEAAESLYNHNFLASFDEAKALKEGCWKSDELVYASYKFGKLDPSQYTSKNKHLVRLSAKRCLDDLEVHENEVILFGGEGFILFSIDEDNDERGYFRFIDIYPLVGKQKRLSGVIVYEERWKDRENNAYWWEEVKGKSLKRWLNRETLTYHLEAENCYRSSVTDRYRCSGSEVLSWPYKIIEEQEFRNLLKKIFIATQQKAAQEEEIRRSEEIEQKKRRKL